MFRLEKASRDQDKFPSPSFSSTLLDQIYRSIDQDETKNNETKFYRDETTPFNKQTDRKHNNKKPRSEKSIVAKVTDNRKSRQQQRDAVNHEYQDSSLFFSSTSISSDSSSSSCGGFSSSDTDSSLPRAPKPVITSASASFRFDGICRNFEESKQGTEIRGGEEALLTIKNKSRALKIYNNLKKVKQPISPGGRLTSFLNSLFATAGNNVKKNKKSENKVKFTQEASTCSSARSCLSKTTSSSSHKTVRFCQVEEKESKVVKETARKFLEEYRKKKNDLVLKDLCINHNEEKKDLDDDDVASCASSDLFELDHLAVFGSARYREELPVYETTRVGTVF